MSIDRLIMESCRRAVSKEKDTKLFSDLLKEAKKTKSASIAYQAYSELPEVCFLTKEGARGYASKLMESIDPKEYRSFSEKFSEISDSPSEKGLALHEALSATTLAKREMAIERLVESLVEKPEDMEGSMPTLVSLPEEERKFILDISAMDEDEKREAMSAMKSEALDKASKDLSKANINEAREICKAMANIATLDPSNDNMLKVWKFNKQEGGDNE